jgi:hypothetical protein
LAFAKEHSLDESASPNYKQLLDSHDSPQEEQSSVAIVGAGVNNSRSTVRTRSPVRSRGGRVLGLVLWVGVVVGCERYESPCRVGSEQSVLEGIGSSASLTLSANGNTLVTWFRYAEEGGVTGPSNPLLVRIPTGVEIANINPDGNVADRQLVAAPSALVKRKGSTDSIGAVWTGKGAVFYWVEKSTQTAPDGSSATSSNLKVQFVAVGGQEGDFRSPPNGDCHECGVRVSAASSPGGVSVLYAKVPSASSSTPIPEQPDANFMALSADGAIITTGTLPWVASTMRSSPQSGGLGLPTVPTFSSGGNLPRVENLVDTLVVKTERGVWAIDPGFVQIAGPITDALDALLLWDVKKDVATTVSTRILLTLPDAGGGAGVTSAVGEEPDLTFQRFDNDGSFRGRSQRVSTGSQLKSFAGGGGQYGVVFSSGQSRYFALLDGNGSKIGGDMEIGSVQSTAVATPGTALGVLEAASVGGEVLSAGGAGRFIHLSSDGGRVRRREIVCAQ